MSIFGAHTFGFGEIKIVGDILATGQVNGKMVVKGRLRPETTGATQESFPLFRCPGCKRSGTIDEDQFHGRVSIQCPFEDCSYHETKDWSQDA